MCAGLTPSPVSWPVLVFIRASPVCVCRAHTTASLVASIAITASKSFGGLAMRTSQAAAGPEDTWHQLQTTRRTR